MRIRLIVAFIVVALLAALASAWFINLIVPFYPWLAKLLINPVAVQHLFYSRKPGRMYAPAPPAALAFCLTTAGLLLAAIIGLAFAASRRVLLPVRRLAQAAQRMSGGDLSVRIEPAGRDELAQLVTTFNAMASALDDKIGELQAWPWQVQVGGVLRSRPHSPRRFAYSPGGPGPTLVLPPGLEAKQDGLNRDRWRVPGRAEVVCSQAGRRAAVRHNCRLRVNWPDVECRS